MALFFSLYALDLKASFNSKTKTNVAIRRKIQENSNPTVIKTLHPYCCKRISIEVLCYDNKSMHCIEKSPMPQSDTRRPSDLSECAA